MGNLFLGNSFKGTPTGELKKKEVSGFKDFCEKYLKTCLQGEKNEYYITIGDSYDITPADPVAPVLSYKSKAHFHRNNKSQVSAWLLPFDGDSRVGRNDSCIEPKRVHTALKKIGYNHVIYTTHSHGPDKNRWRLFIPCKLGSPEQLAASVELLLEQLKNNGCDDLKMSGESKTWSSPWFLPTRDDPDDGLFEYYYWDKGRDFLPAEGEAVCKVETEAENRTMFEMLDKIATGEANTGLHAATRDLAYGLVKDGLAPGSVKSILRFLMKDYNIKNPRMKENLYKIDGVVDSAVKKLLAEAPTSTEWSEVQLTEDNRVFTDFPDQKGMMEEIIQLCLRWMPYPNRQIAVIAAHTLISTLGGRVYTLESGSGIVLTALVTGRSTIGKSFIKKFVIWVLNNFQLANVSQDFVGSHFYTSSKNLVAELEEAGSLLSVRTESGQSDKSTAGDMTRVLMYELELATESGKSGYVSSGGQNDKIPPLYSPAVTTIRESVAQIQHEADIINATAVSGVSGRRSHVLIDPVKSAYNEFRETKLPENVRQLVIEIYKKAANEQRKKVTEPLAPDLWVEVKYKNPQYLSKKRQKWILKENKAAAAGENFESTFYGRLGERLPSWAARLAIADCPEEPIITNQHIDISEASLLAELKSNKAQQDSGELDSDVNQTANFVVSLFRGDMTANKSLNQNTNAHLLRDGACELHRIMGRVRTKACYKTAASKIPNIDHILLNTIKTRGIIELSKEEAIQQYKYRGRVLKRV
jgi:hypothetical protein